jgi:hypothetical protein
VVDPVIEHKPHGRFVIMGDSDDIESLVRVITLETGRYYSTSGSANCSGSDPTHLNLAR